MRKIKILDSDACDFIGYDKNTKLLRIQYIGGKIYEYFKVPIMFFTNLITAESVGRYINAEIKPNFQFRMIQEWD